MKDINYLLYLVTDSRSSNLLGDTELALANGVTILQLREKEKTGKEFYYLALDIKKLTDKYNVPLIINDRVDIAMAVGAAGVHLGQSDIPPSVAKKLLGSNSIIGVSVKSLEQAIEAQNDGADYLGVGAIFPTTTKVITTQTEISTLVDICNNVNIPVIAIGGINSSNINKLSACPISGVAVITAIYMQNDAASATRQMLGLSQKLFDTPA